MIIQREQRFSGDMFQYWFSRWFKYHVDLYTIKFGPLEKRSYLNCNVIDFEHLNTFIADTFFSQITNPFYKRTAKRLIGMDTRSTLGDVFFC